MDSTIIDERILNKLMGKKRKAEPSANWKALQKELNLHPACSKKKKRNAKSVHQDNKTAEKSDSPDIWFDDVDELLLDPQHRKTYQPLSGHVNSLVQPNSTDEPTKAVAIDCEMVGVGLSGEDSMLARVSVVNQFGKCLYDKFVKPIEEVKDYRTKVSGVRPKDLRNGETFRTVQEKVSELLQGRILVGHAVKNDLKVLYLDHPKKMIRDTSRYKHFRQLFNGKTPSLKNLTQKVLGLTIQEGEHDSVQDARATMKVYSMFQKEWEEDIKLRKKARNQLKNIRSKAVQRRTQKQILSKKVNLTERNPTYSKRGQNNTYKRKK